MIKTEMMKKYEAYSGETLEEAEGRGKTLAFLSKYTRWLEDKASAYDRLMSGNSKMTMQEIANFKGRPVTVDADGAINAHGAEPCLARGGFAGYSDCWVNDADDYEEIPESFVEIPDGFDWTTRLTLPDGWEAKDGHQ